MKTPPALRANGHIFHFLCVILAAIALVFVSSATAQEKVVFGTNNPFVDVPAVQSAVDLGGTVILKGTFDFGTDAGNHIIVPGRTYPAEDAKGKSTVFIYQKDVTIVGDTDEDGHPLTIIKNGMPPFWIGWDGQVSRSMPPGVEGVDFGTEIFPVDAAGKIDYRDTPEPGFIPQIRYALAFQNVSATIKNICFDSPKHYGIKATAGQDIVIIGNVFHQVQFGGLVHLNNFAGATHIAAGFVGIGMFYAPFVFPAITGRIDVENNVVDDVGTESISNPHFDESVGLGAMITNAAVTIQRNEVRNVGRQANGISANLLASSGIILVDNYATPPLVSKNNVYNTLGWGIWDLAAAAPPPGPTIERNTVVDGGLIGILSESYVGPREGVLIDGNSISQDGLLPSGKSAIVANYLTASMVRSNSFVGDFAGPLVALSNTNNCTLLLNNDKRKTIPPESPTYSLDFSTSNNLVKGTSGTAVDNGTNNTVILLGKAGKK